MTDRNAKARAGWLLWLQTLRECAKNGATGFVVGIESAVAWVGLPPQRRRLFQVATVSDSRLYSHDGLGSESNGTQSSNLGMGARNRRVNRG
jgi:hypothetical protein